MKSDQTVTDRKAIADRNIKPEWIEAEAPRTPRPALSVTVLNYNYGRFLAECLESILSQTFEDFEVIVVDNDSSDDSLEVAKSYALDPRVRIVAHHRNVGLTRSLIEGSELYSRGEFIAALSSDDIALSRDAFALQMGAIRSTNAVLAFSAFTKFDHDTRRSYAHHSFPTSCTLEASAAPVALMCQPEVWPAHSGTILRASAYQGCGGYWDTIKTAQDLQLWLMIALEGPVTYVAQELYGVRQHGEQSFASADKAFAHAREVVAIVDAACRRAEGLGRRDVAKLRNAALRAHVCASAPSEAFSGQQRLAALRLLAATRASPYAALTARKFWATSIPLIIGSARTLAIRKLLQRTRDRTPGS